MVQAGNRLQLFFVEEFLVAIHQRACAFVGGTANIAEILVADRKASEGARNICKGVAEVDQ